MMRCFPRLSRSLSLAFWGCALVLLVCLTVRLVWRAAKTETGFEVLRLHWRDATVGWIVGDYESIASREPVDQADYWLRETDRVLKAHPDDAQLTMGAALVLDGPGEGFYLRYLDRNPISMSGSSLSFDWAKIGRAESAFTNKCVPRSVQLAATAAKIAPANVDGWRLYALLLYANPRLSSDEVPRDPNWLTVLDDCARHDPDNALYDYLAADFHWSTAADIDFESGPEQLVIKDAESFKKGIARFEQGQAKHLFAFGDMGVYSTAAFLANSRAQLTDQEGIVSSRGMTPRRPDVLRDLWRCQKLRADQKAAGGDPTAALMLSRQNLYMIDQFQAGSDAAAYDATALLCKTIIASRMQKFANSLKGTMSAADMRQIATVCEEAMLDREVVDYVEKNRASAAVPPTPASGAAAAATWADGFVVGDGPSLVVLLLLIGMPALVLSRCAAENGVPVVGPIGQLLALAAAIATTAIFFGLAPAEFINRRIQEWFFTACVFLVPVALIVCAGWYWLRKCACQFSIRAMLILTLIMSLFFSLIAVLRLDPNFPPGLPFSWSIPARGWNGVDSAVYRYAIPANAGECARALFQWEAYYGPCLTVALWAVLVAIFHRRKLRRAHRKDGTPLPPLRTRLAGLLRSLGRPALAAATLVLLAYLLLVPDTLAHAEQDFQAKMAYARHPETFQAEMDAAIQKVRSDGPLITELRARAKASAATAATPK